MTVELVGIKMSKILHMESTKKFTAVNKRTGSLAESWFISDGKSRSMAARAPGPAIWFFQDHQWKQRHDPSFKPQASSTKSHAPIFRKKEASGAKLVERQATSVKPQAPGFKLQAASIKLHDL